MSTTNLPSYKNVIVGDVCVNDIIQGGLGDCYYLSACSAVAEQPARFHQAIATSSINKGGVFAANIYSRGIPFTYYIDDYVPFSGKNPAFAKMSTDGSLWPMLMEKMWAKINGNYE